MFEKDIVAPRKTTAFRQLHRKLCTPPKTTKELEPEELLVYFEHWTECLYTGAPVRVKRTRKSILVDVGHPGESQRFRVAWKKQDFFALQSRWDSFLQSRVWR